MNEKLDSGARQKEADMADPLYPDPGDATHVGPRRGSAPGTPRWVKVFGIIAVLLVLLFVILHLTGHSIGGHTMHGIDG
ncbi:MAG: hypothetical protein DLM58_01400 [Pseudonocardiales bacterium]|nr:MAG: hypothetical protein DLM58_01400 [Pseudonocardiales bacterium]